MKSVTHLLDEYMDLEFAGIGGMIGSRISKQKRNPTERTWATLRIAESKDGL